MTLRARVSVGLFAVTLGAFAVAAPLVNVPLRWKPTSELRLAAAQMTAAAVQFEPFKDTREMPEKVGENREDDTPKPVTTSDDVGAFVSNHMRHLCSHA